jgi:DnaK suppressor protein
LGLIAMISLTIDLPSGASLQGRFGYGCPRAGSACADHARPLYPAPTVILDLQKAGGSGRRSFMAGEPNVQESGYKPSDDETFMNPRQLAYFKQKLIDWKDDILRESQGTLNTLQKEPMREPDLTDRASSETDWSIELRTRDRQRKLVSKIEAALRRIEEGEYGYCEVSGDPISLGRLEARPIATMTVDAQERHERQEKISRDE